MNRNLDRAVVAIIGLGYVGLPLAQAFAKSLKVIGFDIKGEKVKQLSQGNNSRNLTITDIPQKISKADFIIICVPTPVTKSREPDLSYITSAARTVSQNMKKDCVVILESTVFPSVTEKVVKPILEESGLKCGEDFKIAYSPERINPGDEQHAIDKVTKVVAGVDEETTEAVAQLYKRVTPHIFRAKDIKTAEAAKVIENIQRDLNLALVNELALIFEKMGLSTQDVLDAAATKWNFHRYSPGLVGGHCIPVDPYYLVYEARKVDYYPQVILAGRAINDYMPKHVVEVTIKALNNVGKKIKGSRALIIGLTYKENVADTRETPVREIIKGLREYGVEIFGYEPLLSLEAVSQEFNLVALENLDNIKVDCVILAVAHSVFRKITLEKLKKIMGEPPVLIDVRGFFDPDKARKREFVYKGL